MGSQQGIMQGSCTKSAQAGQEPLAFFGQNGGRRSLGDEPALLEQYNFCFGGDRICCVVRDQNGLDRKSVV